MFGFLGLNVSTSLTVSFRWFFFLYKLKALSLYQGMSVATKHVSFVVVIFVVYVLNPVYSGSNRLVT